MILYIRSIFKIKNYSSAHVFYIRWLLISSCAYTDLISNFDLLKSFGFIEIIVKSDFFSEKDLVYIIRAQLEMSNHLI